MFNQDLHQTAGMPYEYLHTLCPISVTIGYTLLLFFFCIPSSDITQNYGNKLNLISFMRYQHLPQRYRFLN